MFPWLSIAPMIDWSYLHFRILMRLLAPKSLIYTEMHTPGAVIHNPRRALARIPFEDPVVLQLGGSDPNPLREAALQGQIHGFSAINLNIGCPSDRVQAGKFGACLMLEPKTVVSIIQTLKDTLSIPVTAKIRLGVDNHDSYDFFEAFAVSLIESGCDGLIVHARKAWLHGLSPKENRTIPPVQYDYVYRLKAAYPSYPIVINGNIRDIVDIKAHLQKVDGVMLGRLACDNPYAIAEMHHHLYPDTPLLSREEVIQAYWKGIEGLDIRVPRSLIVKPLIGMYYGTGNAKAWRKEITALDVV
jgi:tRNA-dihydrouridine synthase A